MIPSRFIRTHRWLRQAGTVVSASATAVILTGTLQAKPVPDKLGNGLDKLVASNLAVTQAAASGVKLTGAVEAANGLTYADETTATIANNSIYDEKGRVLVRVNLNNDAAFKVIKKAMKASASTLAITAVDKTYKGAGVLNAYIDASEVPALANVKGVTSVILEWKPQHNKSVLQEALAAQGGAPSATVGETITKIGTTFDQGVTQHGIDQINKLYNSNSTLDLEGQGMQIACISNSFAANAAGPASVDVTNFDLPGAATNPVNTTPVFVLQDDLSSSTSDDEGRGMCQIAYKMAPKAAIAFATADSGEVGFANNIRGLAGIAGYTISGQTFAADTICDDVGYFDEPFFQDGIIGFGITDAFNAGVSYFSSAANDIGTNGYDSDTRWVAAGTGLTAAAGNTSLTNTNINLANVPTALYAGGFHNFNPSGLDVAQTVNIAANNTVPTEFQWNDPYDQNTSVKITGTLYSGGGTYTTAAVTIPVTATVTAGTSYEFVEAANGGSTDTFDAIVTVYKSDGATVLAGPQDTGVDETVRLVAPTNDTGFVVKVDHYGTTTGSFSLNVYSFSGFTTPPVSTSLSILVFNLTTGAYIPASSLTTDATATNEPMQLGYTNKPTGATQVQYVIARSIIPANTAFPTHLRYLLPGNGRAGYGPAEYFRYNTVTTGGHAASVNSNGCAAYSVFRPSLAETFSSPGPVTIYYDKNDNFLSTPEVRLQPHIALADGANVSANLSTGAGFASDGTSDPDTTQGQFFGTSATGPHAAAIAALVLQAKGGRRSVTPTQMTSLLERSTLPHDLDPNFSSGAARVTGGTTGTGKVTITISSDGSAASTTGLTGTGGNDTHSFAIQYVGGSTVTSFVLNPGGTAATAGNVTGGNNGVTYNAPDATVGGTVSYFENSLPGVTFLPATKAFTQPTSGTVTALATFTNPSSTVASQMYTMTLTPTSTFSGGSILYFTVGRGVARSSTTGGTYNAVTNAISGSALYSADIFGGGVSLPSGTVTTAGMAFSGTTADGGTFSGTIKNNLGSGWATQDGYGFVNAQTAVSQTVQ